MVEISEILLMSDICFLRTEIKKHLTRCRLSDGGFLPQHQWEKVLAEHLETFWQTERNKEDYTQFLLKYGGLWFMGLDDEETMIMLSA
jgi:hypothetical protein